MTSTETVESREESPVQRHGSNLYPVTLTQRFGDFEMTLDVPEGVWNPTPHGIHLGNVLPSMDFDGKSVIELGTGCGIHAILIGRAGARRMLLTEIEAAINENALHNLRKNGVNVPVETQVADWTHLDCASHEGGAFDVLVTNPPFGKSGKHYRRHFIDTLILDAHKLVRPGGELIFIQSSMADIPRSMRLMEECGMDVSVVSETDGPFRGYYHEDPAFMRDAARVPGGYTVRDGRHYERLAVFRAILPA